MIRSALVALVVGVGCASTPRSAPARPRCPVVTPPAALDTAVDRERWLRWMTCVPLGWEAGGPQALYEEAGPGEESDE